MNRKVKKILIYTPFIISCLFLTFVLITSMFMNSGIISESKYINEILSFQLNNSNLMPMYNLGNYIFKNNTDLTNLIWFGLDLLIWSYLFTFIIEMMTIIFKWINKKLDI